MGEKARIRDKIPSVILTVASGTRVSSIFDDVAPSSSGDADVSFRLSAVNEIRSSSHMHPYLET